MNTTTRTKGIWYYLDRPVPKPWRFHIPPSGSLDRAEVELRRMGCLTVRGVEEYPPQGKPLALERWRNLQNKLCLMRDAEVLTACKLE